MSSGPEKKLNLNLRSIKTNKWSADNFKKHAISMSCTLECAIQSCGNGQRIFLFGSVVCRK